MKTARWRGAWLAAAITLGAGASGVARPAAAEEQKPSTDRWGLHFASVKGGGARITSIDARSPAAWILRTGDVVIAADSDPVRDPAQIVAILAAVPAGKPVLLELSRDGRERLVGIQIPGTPPPGPAPVSVFPPGVGEPPPEPPAPPVIILNVPQSSGGGAAPYAAGNGFWGGDGLFWGAFPPSFSAPGRPEIPGATFPPEPGMPPQAAPQLPGISQPPGFRVPLTPRWPGTGPPGAPGTPADLPRAPPPPGQLPPTPPPAVRPGPAFAPR